MIKKIFKTCIVFILTLEAKLVLLRFKPKIVAVTGSVGKTSTKDAIYSALKGTYKIRKNKKSLNSEIGTPLTILGLDNAWNDPLLWIKNIFLGALQVFSRTYPDWLVIEVGADRPGDVRRTAKWLRPDVVVVTSMPDIPVHVEAFESPEALIEEDLSIISFLKQNGVLIINKDEAKADEVIQRSKVKTYTFGSTEVADVYFSNAAVNYDELDGVRVPTGISCKVEYEGNSVPIAIPGVLGVQHMYPLAAALAVGLSQDIPILTMTTSLAQHTPPPGRMNIIEGIDGSIIIDDSYNASPVAVAKAIEALADLEVSGARIAVIGDMLEIGRYTAAEHKRVGELVAKHNIDYVIGIGIRAEYIAKAARAAGVAESHTFYVRDTSEAIPLLKPLVKKGAAMLVKGSQGIRTERIVEAFMANPERKAELLVRQEPAWKDR